MRKGANRRLFTTLFAFFFLLRNLIPGRSTFEAKKLNAKCYLSVSQGKRFIELAICQQINFLCTTEIFARYRQILCDFASNSTHLSLLAEAQSFLGIRDTRCQQEMHLFHYSIFIIRDKKKVRTYLVHIFLHSIADCMSKRKRLFLCRTSKTLR